MSLPFLSWHCRAGLGLAGFGHGNGNGLGFGFASGDLGADVGGNGGFGFTGFEGHEFKLLHYCVDFDVEADFLAELFV